MGKSSRWRSISRGGRCGRGRTGWVCCGILGLCFLCLVVPFSAGLSTPAAAATLTPPDLKIKVPTNDISVGTNQTTGHRQLQFTHITWDAGTGPFVIQPSYDPVTGMSKFSQLVYNSSSPGVWTVDHKVPLAVPGTFDPPSDYRYPLTRFTLNPVNSDGSVGPVLATSPKTDYCITADAYVGGVPNTPNQTYPPQSDCTNPRAPLGFSVGWGDQYDQTDNGQPIDLTGIPNGSYYLRATVDPQHIFTESNVTNDVVLTKLLISGGSVSVLSQKSPSVTPPSIAITSPRPGADVSGKVPLKVTVSTPSPTTVRSVQYLLDGEPLGPALKVAPYTYNWTVGSSPLGKHRLSAQVTNSRGDMGTASPETLNVVSQNNGTLAVDASTSKNGTGTVSTAPFSTSVKDDTLLAFVGSDGPAASGGQSSTVSGGGLAWRLIGRENHQWGDAEIWSATAGGVLSGAQISSHPAVAGYDQQLTVLAYMNSGGVGSSATASASSGAPSISLTTAKAGSFSVAVGTDWDTATARSPAAGQSLVSQWTDTGAGNTFWTQDTTTPSGSAGQTIALRDSAPISDRWDLAAVEVTPSAAATPSSATSPATTPAVAAPAPPAPTVAASAAPAPIVQIVNPTESQALAGTVPVVTQSASMAEIAAVHFFLDGRPIGVAPNDASGTSAIRWDTRSASNGNHVLRAVATDRLGRTAGSDPVVVTVENPNPEMTCFVLQQVQAHGQGTVSTPIFHTAAARETLVALVASDAPVSGVQHLTVSGAGLTWRRVAKASMDGDAEIWTATAPAVLNDATVTSTPSVSGYQQQLSVIAMEGTSGVGATAPASGNATPHVSLVTSRPTSLVFAVAGWQSAQPAATPPGWVVMDHFNNEAGGPSFATEYTNSPAASSGSVEHPEFLVPGRHRWDMAAVELRGDG